MPADLYQPTYLILITILTYFLIKKYSSFPTRTRVYNLSYQEFAFFLTIFLVFFIGLRPISEKYFYDMAGYSDDYNNVFWGARFWFSEDTENIIFDNLKIWMASEKIDSDIFFILIAGIYFIGIWWACKKIFPKDTYLAFLVYLGAFSTFAYGVNGIKAGAAASLFLIALAYEDDKKIIAIIFLFLSFGFHHSMKAPIVAFVIAYFYKKPKVYLYGWLFSLFLAAIHISYFMNYFSGYTDEHGADYLKETENVIKNVSGFRPDFILYSAIPIFLGYYLISQKIIEDKFYNFLWCIYTLTNCVFLLCTYGSYINRIAYLSWLMLPFVLLYPFVNTSWGRFHPNFLKYVVFGHLGFTLFMHFIYYGIQ